MDSRLGERYGQLRIKLRRTSSTVRYIWENHGKLSSSAPIHWPFRNCIRIPEYNCEKPVILWQEEARAEQHTRTSDGLWLLRDTSGIDQSLQLVSIGQPLPLSTVYKKVKFKN